MILLVSAVMFAACDDNDEASQLQFGVYGSEDALRPLLTLTATTGDWGVELSGAEIGTPDDEHLSEVFETTELEIRRDWIWGVHVHLSAGPRARTRSMPHPTVTAMPRPHGHEAGMQQLLDELEATWKQVSQYDDIEARVWTPGKAIADKCPHGCRVVDTGWRSMQHDGEGEDAYRRTVFCRNHDFARIYVISGASAREHGWTPLPVA
ncbi:MAG: hypothetical protein ACN0LA_10725 [Candidatus Longimicrobiales bacterium M2_2A_002]